MNYFKTKKNEAKAVALQCPISYKLAIELARALKKKPVKKALHYLDEIMELRTYLPLKKYNMDVGHKKGQAINGTKSGRFPVKVAKYFKSILNAAVSNADVKGLDKDSLLITGVVVSIGVRRFKVQPKGRRRTRRSKATNVEIMVKEIKGMKGIKSVAKSDAKSEKADAKEVAEKSSVDVEKKEVKKPVKKSVSKNEK